MHLPVVGGVGMKKLLVSAGITVLLSLGAYAFSAVNREFVHSSTYARDRATDSLQAIRQAERSSTRDSILNAKLDEIGLGVRDLGTRITQMKCGPDIARGCR